jgi:ATP-dependent Clp protease protease subunit
MFCKYYMKFTGMSPDEVEAATCRDTFMTPEQAQDAGIIDGIYAADDDYVTPPAVVKGLQEAGLIDRLSGGVLSVGRPGTLS